MGYTDDAERRNLLERLERLESALAESEQRYIRLARAVTDYTYTVRVEGGRPVETRHGPGCLGITGYTEEELSRATDLWIRMVPDSDRAAVVAQAERVLRGEEAPPLEHRIVRKDGAVRWVSDTPVPNRDADGALVGYDGLIRDITDRKDAEAALQKSQEKCRRLFDTSPEAMFLIGPDGRFLDFNAAALERYGYGAEELRAMTPAQLAARDLAGHAPVRVEKALSGETRFSWRHLAKEGRVFPVEITTKPIEIDGRRCTFAEARDVTAQWAADAAIREGAAILRTIFEATGESVFMISPEGTVLACNSIAAKRLGTTSDELVGSLIYAYLPEELAAVRREHLDEAVREAKPVVFTDWRGGLCLEHNVYPILDESGRVSKLAIYARDVTERMRAEEALRQKIDDLERFNKLTVDREMRMVELKREVNALREAAGMPAKYQVDRCDSEI